MKLENNLCLCACPESEINVYKIFPEKSLFSRINTNIECAIIWYLYRDKICSFYKFLARIRSIWMREVIFCLLLSKMGKYLFVLRKWRWFSFCERINLSSSRFIVQLRGILNLTSVTCKFSVFMLTSVYTSLDKPLFNDLCGGFLKDDFSYPCRRPAISLRPHDRTMELSLGSW